MKHRDPRSVEVRLNTKDHELDAEISESKYPGYVTALALEGK